MRMLVVIVWIAAAAGCGPALPSSAAFDPNGILLVNVGDEVQTAPPTEAGKIAFSDALAMAEASGEDLGYPWFDQATGELVLSAVNDRGHELIDAAAIAFPHRVRSVAHGAAELEDIRDAATGLSAEGLPGAQLIYATTPDYRDNRTLIVVRAMSQPLLDALSTRFPPDAIAVRVNPEGTG